MYSDVICDALFPFRDFLKENGLPNLSTEDIIKLKILLIDMIYQMRYVVFLSDCRGANEMCNSVKFMRTTSSSEAVKLIDNKKANKRLDKRTFRKQIEKILTELLDAIDKDYSYNTVYFDVEMVEMLTNVKKVIDFLKGHELSFRENNAWATEEYTRRMDTLW
jgi:hypothetical protein